MKETLHTALGQIWHRKLAFFGMFFIVSVVTYGVLYAVDFFPEPITDVANVDTEQVEFDNETPDNEQAVLNETNPQAESALETKSKEESVPAVDKPLPERVVIDALGTDVEVFNPDTINVAELDAVLLNGVARHPLSGDFQDKGNMLIFGHSSYLPNVLNSNFQAFNGVQKLTWGDKIRVESNDMVSEYRVDRVYEAKASDTVIDNARGEATLTLVTCNSFATTDDRFIVEATLVGEKPLS